MVKLYHNYLYNFLIWLIWYFSIIKLKCYNDYGIKSQFRNTNVKKTRGLYEKIRTFYQ